MKKLNRTYKIVSIVFKPFRKREVNIFKNNIVFKNFLCEKEKTNRLCGF